MKRKYLLSLFVPTTIIFNIILEANKPATASEATFHCQQREGKQSTLIKSNNGLEKSVFHWNLDKLDTQENPQQLCNSVTQKLNQYLIDGNDPSTLTFGTSITFDEIDSTPLPVVCIAGEEKPCQVILFTLSASEDPQLAASNALNSILDPDLQTNPVKSPKRGVQQTAYKVDIWQLFGFKKQDY